MTAGRGDRAAPPAAAGHWEIRFADGAAFKGWDALAAQAAENTFRAWLVMRTDPPPQTQTNRHHRLKGALAHGRHRGATCEHWQIEVTGGGRIWYLADSDRRTCWITYAGNAHPRATDH